MTQFLRGNAIVGQSGGPTAAINATLSGVIRGVTRYGGVQGPIGRLYGMRNGIEGMLEGRITDLTDFFDCEEKLKLLEQTPSAVLGSCRKKLPDLSGAEAEDGTVYRRLFDPFREKEIHYFFYIGGNDSMDTVLKLSEYARRYKYDLRVVGVPKTIDNDLPLTDHTPGYGSAAKFVATVTQEILRDCAVYTLPAVTMIECMGRDAGWLTAASALGRRNGGSAPDLIYLPERPFEMERFLEGVAEGFQRKKALVVAVSEGLRFADGQYVGEGRRNGTADGFGHRALSGTGRVLEQAVKERFGCKARSVELNLLQRCAGHLLSRTDIEESVRIGFAAVQAAVEGISGEVMVFHRLPGEGYRCEIGHEKVLGIANQTRYVPDEFITETADGITDLCCEYLLPLIDGECDVFYKNGVPIHLVL